MLSAKVSQDLMGNGSGESGWIVYARPTNNQATNNTRCIMEIKPKLRVRTNATRESGGINSLTPDDNHAPT